MGRDMNGLETVEEKFDLVFGDEKAPKSVKATKPIFPTKKNRMRKIGNIFLKNIGHSLPLFHLLSSFQISTQLTVNVQYKFYP